MGKARGALPPVGSESGAIRSTMGKGMGDANMQDGGLSFGKVAHGQRAGKHDAQYATFTTRSGIAVYDVPHDLGFQPGFVLAVHMENTQSPTSHYSVLAYERDKWTKSGVRVHVALVGAGSMDGGSITLLIGGER